MSQNMTSHAALLRVSCSFAHAYVCGYACTVRYVPPKPAAALLTLLRSDSASGQNTCARRRRQQNVQTQLGNKLKHSTVHTTHGRTMSPPAASPARRPALWPLPPRPLPSNLLSNRRRASLVSLHRPPLNGARPHIKARCSLHIRFFGCAGILAGHPTCARGRYRVAMRQPSANAPAHPRV